MFKAAPQIKMKKHSNAGCKDGPVEASSMVTNVIRRKYLKAYEDFADAIFRHCYFRTSNKEKAKDLVQETFIKVWEYAFIKKNEVQNIKALLYKTANNLIIDEYRKNKPVSLEMLQEKGFEPVSLEYQNLETIFSAKELLKLIEHLEPKYKNAVIMRYVDGLSPKEIAQITGENENNISVRINRGIKKIKELAANEHKK